MQSVSLVDYQSAWPSQFNEVASELARVFTHLTVRIEHIGSTAVPGLCAKPVLDILLGVETLDLVESRINDLEKLGYVYRPEYEVEIPNRRYFVCPEGARPRVHLHAVVEGGHIWLNHLKFRDALRASPSLAREYGALKRLLAVQFREDKAAYTAGKAPFIADVLAK